jgi:hypothetical protein
VDHPEVPMDNNTAERCQRGPVVARKNFYGSGALWSGRLAAMLSFEPLLPDVGLKRICGSGKANKIVPIFLRHGMPPSGDRVAEARSLNHLLITLSSTGRK